ncbi:MAG TPA: hypothetical protein VH135_09030, partial [Steroidobacteraceae bacterium]|nr:hypothetical protein [Steroidobacteraceae bacterium]
MSLRLKLLLLGLLTLVLPWAGCRYAREMESALREGEQTSLASVAETLATSLEGRVDLLYRAPQSPDPQDSAALLRSGPYDLKPLALGAAPPVDGYSEDWPRDPSAWAWYQEDAVHRFGVLSGVFERVLYLLLEVRDAHPVFDAPGASPLDARSTGDRVWLGFQDPEGAYRQVFLAATGPGAVTARYVESGEYGEKVAQLEPRIRGAWQLAPGGYRLELRVPLSMLGADFGVLIDDRDTRGATPVSYGSLHPDDLRPLGRLIMASPELATYLAQFAQPGLKLAVTTPAGQVLARVDQLKRVAELAPAPPLIARLYRRFVDQPGTQPPIEARVAIYDREHTRAIGALEVTQTPDRWLRLRDRALTRMLNFTLATSVVVVIAMFAFAAWLALRLSRLRQASESALTRTGLVASFPDTHSRDELGDVARSFSSLL